MKKVVLSALALIILALAGCGKIELKQKSMTLELGEDIPDKAEDYIKASENILKEAQVRTNRIDNMTTGQYEAYVTYKQNYYSIKVIVEDTTPPEVELKKKGEYVQELNKAISSADIIKSAEDLAGIKTVSFAENQINESIVEAAEKETGEESEEKQGEAEDELPVAYAFYDESGVYENELIVTDMNGNETKVPVKITITGEYDAHISGVKDLVVQQGTKPDWLAEIEYDEKIISVEVDDSAVDVNTLGEYKLIYRFKGDDKKTIVEKEVKVTVITVNEEAEEANTSQNGSEGSTSNSRNRTNDSNTNSGNSGGGSGGNPGGGSTPPSSGGSNPSLPAPPEPTPDPGPTEPDPGPTEPDPGPTDPEE